MSNIIYFSEHHDAFQKIVPLLTEICLCAELTETMTAEVIVEYRVYYQQLSAMGNTQDSVKPLNHACHIILGLLIKARL
ncbi:hypothetical protein [Psychromonas sp. Urea-02u-13]|uniref:hypothetical protein n=1 Tax=Psychromonas sp. Urea-02u-13 TaxID=2058326 RepID=UPI000C326189|nr:hypothetical protein [Psychromonas sp. Urea-02u-13]PKG38354.1 hypothetical protein CXF74_13660 [Psychromonas sp. Urea-02u-13]